MGMMGRVFTARPIKPVLNIHPRLSYGAPKQSNVLRFSSVYYAH
jgi:hypothetical protein